MVFETDAVTSGFILTLLTSPVVSKEMLEKWLPKGGVQLNEAKGTSHGDYIKDTNDSYETGAELMLAELGGMAISEKDKQQLAVLVGKDFTTDTEVDSGWRKFMKSPFMTFIYGANPDNIAKNMASNIVFDLYTKIEGMPTQEIQTLANTLNIKEWIGKSKAEVMDTYLGAKTVERLEDLVASTYGNAIKKVMESEFNMLIQYRKTVNKSFEIMFNLFNEVYEKEVASIENISENQRTEVIKKLLNMFPSIRPALGNSENLIPIIKEIVGLDGGLK
jgi:hypothetical protein